MGIVEFLLYGMFVVLYDVCYGICDVFGFGGGVFVFVGDVDVLVVVVWEVFGDDDVCVWLSVEVLLVVVVWSLECLFVVLVMVIVDVVCCFFCCV